jgi:hypothetical protein
MDFRGVLKKHEVRMVSAPAAAAPHVAAPAAGGPQARIVRQTDTEAIVEITCACGTRTQIRCAYPRAT